MKRLLNLFNEWLAVAITQLFGKMWTVYFFAVYGFIPVVFRNTQDTCLYWSNWVQLWALPLLMVGQNILNRESERRARETHDLVVKEMAAMKEMIGKMAEIITEIKKMEVTEGILAMDLTEE